MFKFAIAKNMSNFLVYLDFLVIVTYICYNKKKCKTNPNTVAPTLKPHTFCYIPNLVNTIYPVIQKVSSLNETMGQNHVL